MIIGVGIDVVACDRVARLLARHGDRFQRRCFAPGEVLRPAQPEHIAGLLAAKEAAFKAFAPEHPSGIRWRDLIVVRTSGGAPRLAFEGGAAERARQLGVEKVHLSISHDGGVAVAVVVLEG